MNSYISTQISIFNDKQDILKQRTEIEEFLKPKSTKKESEDSDYYKGVCHCHGHNPNGAHCYCICSCPPWCKKYCSKRENNPSDKDVDEDILNEYNKKMKYINILENQLITDLRNNKISINEFHNRYDNIVTLKNNMPSSY